MSKKITILFLILSLCLNQLSLPVFSQDSQEYLYTESNGEITITKYLGPDVRELSIPGIIDGKPVTQIADSIFIREDTPANGAPVLNAFIFTELKKIIIPENVKYIGRMFIRCENLETIEIPSTVTEIKQLPITFLGSFKLQSINVSKNNLNYSSEDGVLFNKDKSELIYYPRSKRDTYYTVPLSVTTLGPLSINSIYLNTLDIHEKIKNLSSNSISCTSLKSINVSSANPYFTSQNGVLYNKDKSRLIQYPQNKSDTEFTIPSTVSELESSSLDSNYLESVTITENVYNISYNLSSSPKLKSIIVYENNPVLSSNDGVLFDKAMRKLIIYPQCKTNTEYSIPLGVEKVASNAFYYVQALTRVNIPSSVTILENTPFWGCANLKSVYFYGDAPNANYPVSFSLYINNEFKYYYPEGSKGFTNPWNGYPAQSFESIKYQVISTPKWEQAHGFSEGLAAVLMDTGNAQSGKRWGYIDTAGNVVIGPKYFEAGDFNEGAAPVKDGTIKIIDKTGNVILDSANLVNGYSNINEDYSSSTVCSQGIIGFNQPAINCTDMFDLNGTFAFGSDDTFKSWLLPFSEDVSCGAFYHALRGTIRNGFIDINRNIIYPENTAPGYLYSFDQGLALAGSKDKNGNMKFGFIDKSGKFTIAPQYDNVFLKNNKQAFFEGLAVVSQNNKWGAIDKTGKYIISPVWDNMHIFQEGLAWIEKDDKWGCIDKNGNVVIKPSYDGFTTFANGIALVKNVGKFCFIDRKGNYLGGLKEDIDNISCSNDSGIILTTKNNLFGAIKVVTKLETPETTSTPVPTKLTIPSPSYTVTPVPTIATPIPTNSSTPIPTNTPTETPVPSYTVTPTHTNTFPGSTDYPTPTYTATPTPTPMTSSVTYPGGYGGPNLPTQFATYTPTPTHTPVPTLSAAVSIPYSMLDLSTTTASPTITPDPASTTQTPASVPTHTPMPTPTNTANTNQTVPNTPAYDTASNNPTTTPSVVPTVTPTATPSAAVTVAPSPTPVLKTEPTAGKPAAAVFKDIQSHWAKDQIMELVSKNIINGYENGLFKPDSSITRAELSVIIVKVLGLKFSSGDTKFKDDKDIPAWAKTYVKTAAESDIISGYGDNTFKSNKPCSRQEIVTMIMRAFKLGSSTSKLDFKDSSDIHSWARDYIAKAIELQIIKGYEDMTFRPGKNVTRAEAAVLVSNSLKKK